jgi:hypothetical protein
MKKDVCNHKNNVNSKLMYFSACDFERTNKIHRKIDA